MVFVSEIRRRLKHHVRNIHVVRCHAWAATPDASAAAAFARLQKSQQLLTTRTSADVATPDLDDQADFKYDNLCSRIVVTDMHTCGDIASASLAPIRRFKAWSCLCGVDR